jgi:hypothetical protein
MYRDTICCSAPNIASQMEKDEDLQKMILSTYFAYARGLKMAWDAKN